MISTVETIAAIDYKLSKRFLELDPAGYFIIYLDREAGLICAKHFTNSQLAKSAEKCSARNWQVSSYMGEIVQLIIPI